MQSESEITHKEFHETLNKFIIASKELLENISKYQEAEKKFI